MHIIEKLADEHALLERVVGAFERYLDAVEARHKVERHDLYRFVTFFADFADAIHHAREEGVLFVALEQHGFSGAMGPLAHIREQHSHERALFARLKRAATVKYAWTDDRIAQLAAVGRELVEFERAHMKKEDELLYPAAERELSADDVAALDKAMKRFDQIHDVEGYAGYLRSLGLELAGDYPPR